MKLYVDLGASSYPIYIENHILEKAKDYISKYFPAGKL